MEDPDGRNLHEDDSLDPDDLEPIMDALYANAVEEMADKAFMLADQDHDGRISFHEFRALVMRDSTLLDWFDSIGTVF
jgi:Ca2+-binding EF-hand superfamily protein